MKLKTPCIALGSLLLSFLLLPAATPEPATKVVIAHRGASGYLPEHTLVSYALAYGQGADFIEPDLMLTSDGHLIALHDRTLDATTNVAEVFPDRAREDGNYYAIDFSLEEIRQLVVRERINPATGSQVFPARFPSTSRSLALRVPTLPEIIELVQGLNHATGRTVGIYPETKSSKWHAEQGHEFEKALLEVLDQFGYRSAEDPVIIQSFEPESLIRLRSEGTELRLVQLIGPRGRHNDVMATTAGLEKIAKYANGIGPALSRIINDEGEWVDDNALVREAQARGLVVHPYTLRADRVPPYAASFGTLLERLFNEAGVDGIFTDHPDHAVAVLKRQDQ
jgi:glycerophosphoryl diester phosphodiesterase